MTLEEFKAYCRTKQGVEETYPFKGESVWMKVVGKLFALTFVQPFTYEGSTAPPFHFVNLKCDPTEAELLREKHAAVIPGWHQSKKHWNSVMIDGSLSDSEIIGLIDKSYDLVCAGLTKKEKERLANL